MLTELQNTGLSEKEAQVYLAALEIGRATADQLAKQAGIVRSTTYVQIESLMKKGLMSTHEEGKKTYFSPESPESLTQLLAKEKEGVEKKAHDLAAFLPTLLRQFENAGERASVRFFDGKEGITAMREETLHLKKNDELLIIYSLDALAGIYSGTELRSYTSRRVKKGIRVRSLYARREGPLEGTDIPPLTLRRFIEHAKMPLTSDFFVFGDKVAIMALRGNIFGIIVTSKEIAHSFRILFSLLWNEVGALEHGSNIENS